MPARLGNMEFDTRGTSAVPIAPDSERLLYDACIGELPYSQRAGLVEAGWQVIPAVSRLGRSTPADRLSQIRRGGNLGTAEADELWLATGRTWRAIGERAHTACYTDSRKPCPATDRGQNPK